MILWILRWREDERDRFFFHLPNGQLSPYFIISGYIVIALAAIPLILGLPGFFKAAEETEEGISTVTVYPEDD